jgi:hypothetical protein
MYAVAAGLDTAPAYVVEVYRFPRAGLRKPDLPSPIHDSRFARVLVPGSRGHSIWYEFDYPWELVKGQWTIEIDDGNRVLMSKTFTVVAPKESDCRSPSS